MLENIYSLLIADEVINQYVDKRIKAYNYPATGDFSGTYIVLDPIDSGKIGDYGDDKYLTEDSLIQVDIWSDNRQTRDLVAQRIRLILVDGNGFIETTGPDEWDKETRIYRIARRYRKKVYRQDFDSL